MRWFFLMLLAINFGYVAWELNRPEDSTIRAASPRPVPGHVPAIVLLSELDSVGTPEHAAEKAGSEQAVAETPVEIDTPPVVDSRQSTDSAASSDVKTKPEPKPEKTLKHVADACYTLGPFRELEKLRQVTRDIRDYVADASFRSNEEREQSTYWVYLPSQKSRDEAIALGKQLEQKKIRDYYVINSGQQKNGVSLGHFKEKSRALNLLGKVTNAGFEPVMEPVFRAYTIYWLDYRVQADGAIPENVLDLRNLPDVNRIDRDCGQVSPGEIKAKPGAIS